MRWMKFAGSLGIVLLTLSFLNYIVGAIGFFGNVDITSSLIVNGTLWLIIGFAILFLYIFSYIFFLFGFVKMGDKAGSKLLKITSIITLVVFIITIILFIVGIIMIISTFNNLASGMDSFAMSEITAQQNSFDSSFDSFDFATGNLISPITGNAVSTMNGDPTGIGGLIAIILSVIIVIFFVAFVAFILGILFFIGLIQVGDKVRYAKMAGIFGLIVMVLSIPFSILRDLLLTFSPLMSFIVISIVFVFSWVLLLLETFALFDASRKFEGNNFISQAINKNINKLKNK